MAKSLSKLKILKEILNQRKAEIAFGMPDDMFFNFFSCEQILKDFELTYEEIKNGIVDGSGDGGIDAIYTFINGGILEEDTDLSFFKKDIVIDLIIIQSKNTSGFSEEAINKLTASASDLLNLSSDLESLKSTYNDELRRKIELFKTTYLEMASKFPRLNICYYYSALADDVHDNVSRKVKQLEKAINAQISDSHFQFDFIDIERLLVLARKKPLRVKTINVDATPISTKDGGYVALVSLSNYFDFITDCGKLIKSFFDANIRDYQGKIEVNKAIAETLGNPNNEDFWWLNNGVTITTTKASLTGQSLTIEDPQIVNGLQSSYEIFNHFSTSGNSEDKRKILIRIIKPHDEKSRLKIIKSTNSQTNVPITSLRATDEIHLNIELYFLSKGFYYDRKKNYYKNADKPVDSIISIPYLSQIIASAVLREPNSACSRPSSLIKNDEDYKKIFNKDYDIDIYLRSVIIHKKIEHQLNIYKPELPKNVISDLKFHITTYTVANELKKTSYSANEIIKIDVDKITNETIDNNIKIVKTIYDSLGSNNQVAKSAQFVNELLIN